MLGGLHLLYGCLQLCNGVQLLLERSSKLDSRDGAVRNRTQGERGQLLLYLFDGALDIGSGDTGGVGKTDIFRAARTGERLYQRIVCVHELNRIGIEIRLEIFCGKRRPIRKRGDGMLERCDMTSRNRCIGHTIPPFKIKKESVNCLSCIIGAQILFVYLVLHRCLHSQPLHSRQPDSGARRTCP